MPLIHPVFAAKAIVTADHVGQGRFGINIVSGWNVEEFAMFGIPLREHDERYDYSAEWVSILKRIYSETEPFDHEGKYFNLKNVEGKPKPWSPGVPMLMSAGSSPAGRSFAVNNADCLFMVITEEAKIASDVAQVRAVPGADRCGLYASGHLLCRRTPKETEEYYHYLVREKGDWEAAEQIIAKRAAGGSQSLPPELMRKAKERVISRRRDLSGDRQLRRGRGEVLAAVQRRAGRHGPDPRQLRQRNAGASRRGAAAPGAAEDSPGAAHREEHA